MKQGNVKVCPRCGGTVLGGYAKCPECGYAFMNVGANSSAKLLDSRLNGINDYEKRAHLISSFPIPNTREDLMEFLSALEPKAFARHKGDEDEQKEKKAYYEKYVECLNKAKISFANDPATQMFIEHYRKDKHRLHWTTNQWIVFGFIMFLLCDGLLIWILSGESFFSSCSRENEKKDKIALQPQYEEWKSTTLPQIELYSDSIQNLIDELPTPTLKNYKECIKKVSKISWNRNWPIPPQYENLENESGIRFHGLDNNYKEAFEKRIKEYKKLIGSEWRRDLKNSGFREQEIINTIPYEYR